MLSTIETEQLNKAIFEFLDENSEDFQTLDDDGRDRLVQDQAKRIIRKSIEGGSTRSYQWMQKEQSDPLALFNIEKCLESPARGNGDLEELQDINDEMYILCTLTKSAPAQLNLWNKNYGRKFSELAKALNTATAGSGLEWIPTGFSRSVIDKMELEAKVALQFYKLPMQTNPYRAPLLLDTGTAYLTGEASSDSPPMFRTSGIATDNATFTAKKIAANFPITDEMIEDSAIPMIPEMKRNIPKAVAKAIDNAIINGDTSTTHMDTGYTVDIDDSRRSWNGLRKLTITSGDNDAFLDGSAWVSGATGLAVFRAAVEDLKDYSTEPEDLVCFCNRIMYNKFRGLSEVSTVDKYGPAATIKNGRITQIDGIDLVLSPRVEEKQNATGVYDGTTTTKTQFLIVHKPSYRLGVRRPIKLEYVHQAIYGMDYLVATTRQHWHHVFDSATEPSVVWTYNIGK